MKLSLGLSIDMDNQWSYMKTHGDVGWESYPSYFPTLIPTVMELMQELELPLTFFLVGKDLEEDENAREVEKISKAGFTVANHSYRHEPWLHSYSYAEIEAEISRTDELLQAITRQKPIGFRGPGFSYSQDLLKVLLAHGYEYDASTLPSFIGPLARWYYFKTAELQKEERDKRNLLFGKFSEGFKKNRPHMHRVEAESAIAEFPVTTFPILRSPIHLSYLIYLYRYDIRLLNAYLKTAIFFLKLFRVPVSYLLHPLDFLGGDSVKALDFFPGMDLDTAKKLNVVRHVLSILKQHFIICDMNALYRSHFAATKNHIGTA